MGSPGLRKLLKGKRLGRWATAGRGPHPKGPGGGASASIPPSQGVCDVCRLLAGGEQPGRESPLSPGAPHHGCLQ